DDSRGCHHRYLSLNWRPAPLYQLWRLIAGDLPGGGGGVTQHLPLYPGTRVTSTGAALGNCEFAQENIGERRLKILKERDIAVPREGTRAEQMKVLGSG